MVRVEEAEKMIQSTARNFGTEKVSFELALNRVLAIDLRTDRDLPPYDRVTMDGIAISFEAFEKGVRSFTIKATQAAGDVPVDISQANECIEIMTGAALPPTTDTVVRYEDLELKNGTATILERAIKKGQSVHVKGKDKKENEIVIYANQIVSPSAINIAASVGAVELLVKKLPRVVIISTGDELIEVSQIPMAYQIRRSNNYAVKAALQRYDLQADMLHIPDDLEITIQNIKNCLRDYDVIILSGGISMGKFDYVSKALELLNVNKLFHQVQQRPGKPFWFGLDSKGVLVFAFPGNPVSTFMCLHRFFLPWLEKSIGIEPAELYAILNEDFSFDPRLQYFLQVALSVNARGQLVATPVEGNGSGDFANLSSTNAFMELPLELNNFKKGEVFRIWPFNQQIFL